MWKRFSAYVFALLVFSLTFEEDYIPKNMLTDFKLSYGLDKFTEINFGVRTYDELEYMLNRRRNNNYLDKFVIWLTINF
ncbi:hypothetical protein [Pampinifervens florentissimum]|uniref:hypothetical protein n=1 Tax=Pampinifervens florentissimum TaxID=1632019 RepID=UPI0013B4833A|nr:hypothetical protein [Hydrogenobacter sp. T-8]QID32547.1 hypothetical protein G3M65_01615 [Hydrogenobacter sp. T-8]